MDARRATVVAIAFVVLVACSGRSAPHRPETSARASGSHPTTVCTDPGRPAPTGRIVFDNAQDVWSINADGTGLRRLTRSPWPEFDPSWSPDGRLIAYRSEPHEHPQLWVMNADGSQPHRLTRDGGFPDWSPDGLTIAYAPGGGSSGRSWIAVMNADGSEPGRVPHTDYGEYPSWSPDGTRIAFNSNLSGEALMSIADVEGPRLVDLSSVGEGGQVAWSPDGRSLLFASHRDRPDNSRDIYVMRPDGSGVRRLTHAGAETPAWSPDGSHIVFTAGGLFVMRADGSCIQALPLEGVGEASFPDWV